MMDSTTTVPLAVLLAISGVELTMIAGLVGVIYWSLRRQVGDVQESVQLVRESVGKCATVVALDEVKVLQQKQAKEVVELELRMHEAIKQSLVRIESKMDDNEGKSSKSRHDIRDELHVLALTVRELVVLGRENKVARP